ncbi:acyl carrier protein 2 [Acidiphilium sp. CAG:727]|nr:acyl carrier protein 2 [Acidiphilium sp. CAG:727]
MLTRKEILEKLKSILVDMNPNDASKTENIGEDDKLLTGLGIDSVSMLYMVIAVEETFGIEFDTDKPFVTVGEVIDYIERKVNEMAS